MFAECVRRAVAGEVWGDHRTTNADEEKPCERNEFKQYDKYDSGMRGELII